MAQEQTPYTQEPGWHDPGQDEVKVEAQELPGWSRATAVEPKWLRMVEWHGDDMQEKTMRTQGKTRPSETDQVRPDHGDFRPMQIMIVVVLVMVPVRRQGWWWWR